MRPRSRPASPRSWTRRSRRRSARPPSSSSTSSTAPARRRPWTPTNAQYRANVLEVLRGISARGGRPLLLISARPYIDGDALAWWQQAGQVAEIAREVYFPAPPLMRTGAVLASRTMRQKFRQGLAPLLAAGIPPDRLGLVIGFQSGPGKGGREGLQPTAAWLRFTKLVTLAAKQVAGELRIGSVVTWGWGTFDTAGADARQGEGGLRLAVGARSGSLRRGGGGGARLQRVARRRTDRAAAGHALPRRRQVDLEARREGADSRDRRSPGRAERALRAARRDARTSGCRRSRARGRAGDRLGAVPRLAGVVPLGSSARRERRSRLRAAIIADQLRRQDIARKRQVDAPTGRRDLALPHAVRRCSPCGRCEPTAPLRGSAGGGEASRSCRRGRFSSSRCRPPSRPRS